MKPIYHANSSAKKYGGKPEDYLAIHDYMDSSKAALADVRHRAIFHSAFGCFIVEDVFGHTITNSDGKEISVREIAEDHVLEDLGTIPTLEQWLRNMKIQDWMAGGVRKERETRKDVKKEPETFKQEVKEEEPKKIIPRYPDVQSIPDTVSITTAWPYPGTVVHQPPYNPFPDDNQVIDGNFPGSIPPQIFTRD